MDYKDFFTFTKQERRGIVTFLILSTVTISAFKFWPFTKPQPPQIIKDYYFDTLNTEENESYDANDISDLWDDTGDKSGTAKGLKFNFNPNDISYDSLLLLGFSKYGAKSLVNYVSKGGIIYSREKFKEIYGIDPKLVDELDDFISYPTKNTTKYTNSNDPEKPIIRASDKVIKIIELNSADSIELVGIKGIGRITAYKIIQMRKRTGGFLTPEQLTELNVMHDTIFKSIKNQITVNPDLIKKININTADYKTFVQHPYISSETANALLKYKKQHGPFTDAKHISRIRSLKEETGLKMLPYLDVKDE
ncbi:MAG: helix-hairpin-helix domain-containing protein [Saprospiraceae bacterium]|jgi:competence protein ComEA|nr:helix-hairpin-helix domain-containing protein [Saprospiraceae bacterium]MBK9564631.1 helix-hairpin-helix domain-containing protein [Saprospiraceae bacterium]MBP6447021.1 helix-hairpin-helix domain-containing protein [Saprospiraceae bacterium]